MHTITCTITNDNFVTRRKRAGGLIIRTAALTSFVLAATIGLKAQTSTTPAPHLDLNAALSAPLHPGDSADPGYSSSSSATDSIAAERFSLSSFDVAQPPPRRSYGRPRYSDRSHNPDGTSKYTFEVGGGFTLPVRDADTYLSPGYKFQVGAGRNFNKNFAVLAQFDWDHFGIQSGVLNQLLPIYQDLCGVGCTGDSLEQIGGSNHIWSFSLNPVFNFAQSEKTGAYVVGGVGFYHKVTDFTTPTIGEYCDYYYGCYEYQANSIIDHYTSNAPGFNGGAGFTYRPSRWSNVKFFAEARYVYILNESRPYYDGTTGTSIKPGYFDLFPQNSHRTTYIPVTFGLRF